MQPHPEPRHHPVAAVHRRRRQAGQQQRQRVSLHPRRRAVARRARGVHRKAAFHVGQRLRQLDGRLQTHDAVHVVHPQLHRNHTVGVSAHTQRPQLVHRVGVGSDSDYAVAHLRVAMQGGGHRRGASPHRAVSERHRLLPSRRQCRRQRAAQRRVAEGGSSQRQRLVADVLHRQAARIAAPYRHMAVVHRRRCHLQLRCQHRDRAARGADRQRAPSIRRQHALRGRQRNVARLATQHHAEGEQLAARAAVGGQRQRVAVYAQRVAQHRGRQLVPVAAAAEHRAARHIRQVASQRDEGLQRRHSVAVRQRQPHRHRIPRMPTAPRQTQRILPLHPQPRGYHD